MTDRDTGSGPSSSRRNDDTSSPDRTSNRDTADPKNKDSTDTSRPRGDKDRDRDQSTDRTDPKRRKDSDSPTTRPDRDTNDRRNRDDDPDSRDRHDKDDESKQEKKDKRKEEENSEESKAARLARIVARIRPRLRRLLSKGAKSRLHKSVLSSMRSWYRLTSLSTQDGRTFEDEAVLNPRKIVVRGRELDSEPILLYIRELEDELIKRGGEQADASGHTRLPRTIDPEGRPHFTIPSQLDMPQVAALLDRENKKTTQIWQWASEKFHKSTLMGPYLRKFRNNKTVSDKQESTAYTAIEQRILDAGQEQDASQAFASTPGANRTLGPPQISSDTGFVNSLSYGVERERNRGNMVTSILLADLFGQVGNSTPTGLRGRFQKLFGMHPMAPAGAPLGARKLRTKKYLRGVRVIEKEIAELTNKARSKNFRNADINNPREALDRLIDAEVSQLPQQGDSKARKAAERKAEAKTRKENRELVKLNELQSANGLASREISVIEEWFQTMASDIDVDKGDEGEVQERIKDRIRSHMETLYPWLRSSGPEAS